MALFLMLICLLSICLGYVCAAACWTDRLWQSVKDNDIPQSLRLCLTLPWQRTVVFAVSAMSVLCLGYGFGKYGLFIGAELAGSFIMAYLISKKFLQPKIHGLFHLNVVLRALSRRHMRCAGSDDPAAVDMEFLFEKISREFYAMKIVRAAGLVPTYDGSTLYLALHGAKADNYYNPKRSGTEKN